MSRVRKLLIVGFVLALGLGLAWPFRKTGPAEPGGIQPMSAFDMLATQAPLPRQEPAHTASRGDPAIAPTREPGETSLASHPAITNHSAFKPTLPGSASEAEGVLHIVRNTDTLEKLADRYLGDAGRALEIFDLNRDQLSNPYLLPIGAKLRIPAKPRRVLD